MIGGSDIYDMGKRPEIEVEALGASLEPPGLFSRP
jgi:hypothetical protein